jgi:hypothetical protein
VTGMRLPVPAERRSSTQMALVVLVLLASTIWFAALGPVASGAVRRKFDTRIYPGRGFGPMRVGMTLAQVRRLLPKVHECGCETNSFKVPGGILSVTVYHGRVITMSVNSPRFRFHGVGVGSKQRTARRALRSRHFNAFRCHPPDAYYGFYRTGTRFDLYRGRVVAIDVGDVRPVC